MKEQPLVKDRRLSPPAHAEKGQNAPARRGGEADAAYSLPNQLGNAAFQRFVQRAGDGGGELDEATVARIDRARSGGQDLNTGVQQKMGEALGADFSDVRVHTGRESSSLSQELSALAFTTGHDVFFGEGQYNPHSAGGQELIAHELTHVVQQSSGVVPSQGKMTVNEPGDRFEQEANAAAKAAVTGSPAAAVQRQELPEEEELQAKPVQREVGPDEEELQAQRLQRQDDGELQEDLDSQV